MCKIKIHKHLGPSVIFIIDYLSKLFVIHRNFMLEWEEIDILFDRAYKWKELFIMVICDNYNSNTWYF